MLIAALVYLGIAALCWNSGSVFRPTRAGPNAFFRARLQRRVWLGVTISLAVLAIARLLDLQDVATVFGRVAVQDEGWYDQRRPWQREAIIITLMTAGAVALMLAIAVRRAGGAAVVAMIATTTLFELMIVRTVSLHDVDAKLAAGRGPFTLSRVIEFGLLAFIGLMAMVARRRETLKK